MEASRSVVETSVSCPSHCGRFTLQGTLTHCENSIDAPSRRVCLLLHGGMAHRDSAYQKGLAVGLSRQLGLDTFRYDSVGCGESEPLFAESADERGLKKDEPREQFRNMMSGFWDDLEDARAVVKHLRHSLGLVVDCVCGHSRGGQLALMLAVRHARELELRRIIVVNMRWDLDHWRRAREAYMNKHGTPWVLRWRGRGKVFKHTVSEHDAKVYGEVPMESARELRMQGVSVLVVYGCAAGGSGDTIDGVVPVGDVASAVNSLGSACELRIVPKAGHNVSEDGAVDRLFDAIHGWIVQGSCAVEERAKL